MAMFINLFESYIPPFLLKILKYGKVTSEIEAPLSKNLVISKIYFKHFYIISALLYIPVALYEVTSVYILESEVHGWFMAILDACCGPKRVATVSATHVFVAILLMTLQVWRRFYDTQFVSVFSKKAKISLIHYVPGLLYYLGVILIILSEAPKFAETIYPEKQSKLQVGDVTLIDILAVIIFLWAWYHQHTTTVILANLRKNKKGKVVSETYGIPEGDWFRYLSSPHCTAEILMYTSLSVILVSSRSWWCVYSLVLFNQVDSIISSHKWYHTRFKKFPKERKAFIPFII